MSQPVLLDEGSRLAPGYEVLGHLSRGADLDVYDAWSLERDCRCVIKVMRPDRAGHVPARERLVEEGRLLLGLAHPHLVRCYEILEHPPAVVLETLTGATLARIIAERRRRLPAADLCHLGLHLCSAIGYLHRQGILHLDLKPSNVISEMGHAKVIDLSLARPSGRVEAGLGTRQYLAPEQARGDTVTTASDVFGIGGVLFAAATATRPFPRPDGPFEQLERRAVRVRTLRRLSSEMAATIDACLEPAPRDRPTVGEVRRTLDDALTEPGAPPALGDGS